MLFTFNDSIPFDSRLTRVCENSKLIPGVEVFTIRVFHKYLVLLDRDARSCRINHGNIRGHTIFT